MKNTKASKTATLRVEGWFTYAIRDDEVDEEGCLTSEGYERIVAKFLADYPELNQDCLDIVEADVDDDDDR